jgi:hypothetical protein
MKTVERKSSNQVRVVGELLHKSHENGQCEGRSRRETAEEELTHLILKGEVMIV